MTEQFNSGFEGVSEKSNLRPPVHKRLSMNRMSTGLCLFSVALILAVAVAVCFSDTVDAGFLSDDYYLVNRAGSEGFYSGWGGESGSLFFRPVVVLSFLTDFELWGNSPAGFHLTNLLWHWAAGCLLFLLTRALLASSGLAKPYLYSALAGVLFLVLASHSESVAWISGRTDIIASAFCIASLFFFHRQLRKPSLSASALALILFIAGLLAKESAIITPLLWGILIAGEPSIDRRGNLKRNLLLFVLSLLLAAVYLVFRMESGVGLLFSMENSVFFTVSIPAIAENIIRYSFRVFIPPLPPALRDVVAAYPESVPIALFLLTVPLCIALHKRAIPVEKRLLITSAVCFFVSLLPVLGMKVSLFETQSERFLYLPGVFASVFLTVSAVAVFRDWKKAVLFLALVIVSQGLFLHRSNQNWIHAGELCSDIAEFVSRYDADSVVILSLPDSYNGAWVFRNGLDEAVEMLRGEEAHYTVICWFSLPCSLLYTETPAVRLIIPGSCRYFSAPGSIPVVSLSGSEITLEETSKTVLVFVNGKMERINADE